jgi:hypothetical protein
MLSVGELTTTDGSGVGWDSRKRGFSEYHVQTLQNSHMSIRYLHEAMILVSFYSVLLIPVIYVFGGLLIFLEVLRVNLPASRKSKSEEHPLTSLSHTYRLLPDTKKLMKATVFFAFLSFENGTILELSIAQRSHMVAFSEFSAFQLNLD